MLIKAALKTRNLLILAAAVVLAVFLPAIVPDAGWIRAITLIAGIAVYAVVVAATTRSSGFRRELELHEKLENIRRLNRAIMDSTGILPGALEGA